MKLLLKDQTSIMLYAAQSISSLQVMFPDKPSMLDIWNKLTPDNLTEVQIINDAGEVSSRFTNLVLVSETSAELQDGSILTTLTLREKTEIERLTEEVTALKEDQNTQNSAIEDLGELTGMLAVHLEGGEQ